MITTEIVQLRKEKNAFEKKMYIIRRNFDFTPNLLEIYKLRRTTVFNYIQKNSGGLDQLFSANILSEKMRRRPPAPPVDAIGFYRHSIGLLPS